MIKRYRIISASLVMCMFCLLITGCFPSRSSKIIIPSLGTMKKTVDTKASSNSMISFEVQKGDQVTFTYDSEVEEGTLEMKVTGQDREVIEEFGTNTSDTKTITFTEGGEYDLWAMYKDFVGSYEIYVDK